MSNRAYLYSLNNRPQSYSDRPDTISGLSEFPYFIPFAYRVLMSGDPVLCASLLSEGFDGEDEGSKTKLYAISSDFEKGMERLKKFIAVLRPLIKPESYLSTSLDQTLDFLESHRDSYLLLETIELDTMEYADEENLLECVKNEIAECIKVGEAIDALPDDKAEAAQQIQSASKLKNSVFYGIRLDDDFDNTRDSKTDYPLGLYWSDILYFDLLNRKDFEVALADTD